jgi:hypothetical protein
MTELFERAYSDEISAKDGGFIFQAILNYDLSWAIVDGETSLDQKNIQGWLNQVDVFPDLKFDEGHATLTYVILSEVNLLKRKFELASEAIKRIISPEYAKEMEGGDSVSQEDNLDIPQPIAGDLSTSREQLALPEPQKQLGPGQRMLPEPQKQLPQSTFESRINEVLYTTKLTSAQIKEINNKYFRNTRFDVRFTVKGIVLREVSTSGLDTGSPNVTLKLSTGMVDTLNGVAINSWDNFKVVVTGTKPTLTIDNSAMPKISEILVYDPIENVNELIFRTILPSLIIDFKGDRVQIDTYSNRSSQISIRSNIDFDNLFNIEEVSASNITEPEEGEDLEQEDGGEILKNNLNK